MPAWSCEDCRRYSIEEVDGVKAIRYDRPRVGPLAERAGEPRHCLGCPREPLRDASIPHRYDRMIADWSACQGRGWPRAGALEDQDADVVAVWSLLDRRHRLHVGPGGEVACGG